MTKLDESNVIKIQPIGDKSVKIVPYKHEVKIESVKLLFIKDCSVKIVIR